MSHMSKMGYTLTSLVCNTLGKDINTSASPWRYIAGFVGVRSYLVAVKFLCSS